MKKVRAGLVTIILLFGLGSKMYGQDYTMSGRSAIGLSMGIYSGAKSSNIVAIGGMNTEVKASGFSGSIFYKNYLQEDLALKVNVGVLTGSANININSFTSTTQTSIVTPITLGINYYFMNLISNNVLRPYVSGAIGMYIGSEATNSKLSQAVHSENSFGGRAGIGVDFILGNHFILGANAGYNLMSNFSMPVGGNKNYNGGDFLFQVEYVF